MTTYYKLKDHGKLCNLPEHTPSTSFDQLVTDCANKVKSGVISTNEIREAIMPVQQKVVTDTQETKKSEFEDVYVKYAEAIISGATTLEEVAAQLCMKK